MGGKTRRLAILAADDYRCVRAILNAEEGPLGETEIDAHAADELEEDSFDPDLLAD